MRIFRGEKVNIRAVTAIALAVLVGAFAAFSPLIVYTVRDVSGQKTIVVDAGHGGADAGVVGKTTKVKESELALAISFLLGDLLKGAGFHVVYTRTNDTMLTGVKADTKKRSDMFSRAKIINDAKADAVVSVHLNFFPHSSRRGAQTFFARQNAASFALATAVQDALNVLNLENTNKEYPALTAEKYLLTCSPSPSIIVECGFLSNPADEQLLLSADYQLLLAESITRGILAYFSSSNG